MTVNWRHRIVRVAVGDEDGMRDAVFAAISDGWIFDCHTRGDGETMDLVFRRARLDRPRMAWS